MVKKRKGISIFWLLFFLLTAGIGVYVWLYYRGMLDRFIGPMEEKKKLKKRSASNQSSSVKTRGESQSRPVKTSTEKLTNRQEQVISVLSGGESMTVPQIAKKVKNVSDRTIRRDMNNLLEKGFVAQEGSTKSTVYRYLKG